MTHFSYRFSHAITRRPASSITQGLRAVDTGNPDPALILAHHAEYVAALRAAGMTVVELAPLEDFPDSCFVEDAALCLPQGAIVLRPGAQTRLGEAAAMAPHLHDFFADVAQITGPGFVEGGDILITGREILVGRSARTDAAGIAGSARGAALSNIALAYLHLKDYGRSVDAVQRAIETLAEWKLLLNAIHKTPPTFQRDAVRALISLGIVEYRSKLVGWFRNVKE